MLSSIEFNNNTISYIIEILNDKQNVSKMKKLAALSLINKAFEEGKGVKIRKKFLECNILYFLTEFLDFGVNNAELSSVDWLMMEISMSIVWQLSCLPDEKDLVPLQNETLIFCLVSFLDTRKQFYAFSKKTKSEMEKFCVDKDLVGQHLQKNMTSKYIDKFNQLTGNYFDGRCLPEKLCFCTLYDTSKPGVDINITEELASQELIWVIPYNDDDLNIDKSKFTDSWADIIVTEVIQGPIFWAHIGQDCFTKVKEIHSKLNSNESKFYSCKPKRGNHVVVYGQTKGSSSYFRAQVLESGTSVQAIDYGYVFTVNEKHVYCLPDDLDMTRIPPQASLCILYGSSPTPRSKRIVQYAAESLCNLTYSSPTAGFFLNNFSGFNIILPMLKCPEEKLVANIAKVIHNSSLFMTDNKESISCEPSLVCYVLEFLENWGGRNVQVLEQCLKLLCQILIKNQQAGHDFYKGDGLQILFKLLYFELPSIRKIILKIFRVFLDQSLGGLGRTPNLIRRNRAGEGNSCRKKTGDSAELFCMPSKGKVSVGRIERGSDDSLLVSSFTKKQDENPQLRFDEIKEEVIADFHLEQVKNTQNYSDDADNEGLIKEWKFLASDDPESDSILKFGLPGSKVEFRPDDNHVFMPEKRLIQASCIELSKLICGILNNDSFVTIYFGIEKDGTISGVKMTRDERDSFRLGVDRIMTQKINPSVICSLFNVTCVPIYEVSELDVNEKLVDIPDLYVAEIQIKSNDTLWYVHDDGKCYYYFENKLEPLSLEMIRKITAQTESVKYLPEVDKLESELRRLRKAQNR